MINVSNNFKKAMKEPVKELKAYIKTEDNIYIKSSDDLISFSISGEGNIGKTTMRKLEAKYIGEHNLLGKSAFVALGVKTGEETYEYIDYGTFIITEIETSKDTETTTVVGYDLMINTMKPYNANIVYPITLIDYADIICGFCGLELINETFVHDNWVINTDLYKNIDGITYRDVLEEIAKVTASTCVIKDDKVYFKYIEDTKEKLTYANMFKLKLEPMYGEINSVVLARTPQEDNIYMQDEQSISDNGLTEFKIENNQIIDKDRDNAMLPIYNALHGISYYPFETDTEGLGWYEIGDRFNITNDTNDIYSVVLFNFSISVDGGIKEKLYTKEPTKTQTQYQYASKVEKRIRNTEIIVDKQNQKITSVVSTQEEQSQKVAQQEQIIDEVTGIVTEQTNTIVGLSTQWEQTNKDFTATFSQLLEQVTNLDGETQTQFSEIIKYIRFENGNIVLGQVGNELILRIQNDRISFMQSGIEVAYFSNKKMYITDGEFLNSLTLGNFGFIPRANGNLSFRKVK